MSTKLPTHVYAVIMGLAQDSLILPNSAVVEVLGQEALIPRSDGPDWLLGELKLQLEDIPVVSLEGMFGQAVPATERKGRIVVIKAPSRADTFAVMARSYPLIVTLNEVALKPQTDPQELSELVISAVQVANRKALIPDLDAIAQLAAAQFETLNI